MAAPFASQARPGAPTVPPPQPTPGLFAFLRIPPPTGAHPFDQVARHLRFGGLLVIVGAAAGTLYALFGMAFVGAAPGSGPLAAGAATTGALLYLLVTLGIAAGACFWVSFTYFHWWRRDRRALGHALGIGIVMVVLGGLGVLTGIGDLPSFTYGGLALLMGLLALVNLAISVGLLVLGILVLTNRAKPECQAVFGPAPAAPPWPAPPQG